jgi:hypothetical protein
MSAFNWVYIVNKYNSYFTDQQRLVYDAAFQDLAFCKYKLGCELSIQEKVVLDQCYMFFTDDDAVQDYRDRFGL